MSHYATECMAEARCDYNPAIFSGKLYCECIELKLLCSLSFNSYVTAYFTLTAQSQKTM